MALLLLCASLALVPSLAQAHQCAGADCGPCVEGESHQHADQRGAACTSGDQGAESDEKGIPLGPLAPLAALGLAARALGRARA